MTGISRLLACILWTSLAAAIARAEAPRRDITPDDYFTLGAVTDIRVSPDGKHAAWSELRWEPPAEKRNSDIWVVELKSGEVRRLTFDPAGDASPRWSADGRWIYFTSNRKSAGETQPPLDGKTQVWRVALDGGEALAVTRVPGGVTAFEPSRDGKSLFYTVRDEQVAGEWSDLKKKFKSLEYGHGAEGCSQLWRLDLATWRSTKLVDDKRVIKSFAAAPDGWRIAMITAPSERLIDFEGQSRVDIYDTKSGRITTLPDKLWRQDAPSPYGWIDAPCWSGDGQQLAFRVEWDAYPAEVFVASFKGEDVSLQKLARPDQVSVVLESTMHWRKDDLCYLAEDHARTRVYCTANIRAGKHGPARPLTTGDVAVDAFSFDRSGQTLAVCMSDAAHQQDLYAVAFEKSPTEYKPLARINPQVDEWNLPKIELVKWTGAGGQECEGILETPPGHSTGRLPMIVELHGGPTASTQFVMRFSIYGRTLLPARGYAVFSPNYRGSTGYGDPFLTDLVGRENDIEVDDILRGVDAMIEKGVADPERLGVMGWSNGGFLTNCLITKTTRFKAASSGAGISMMVMQWGVEDTPGHVINFMQGLPWARPEAYLKASAIMNADKVRTPTLFHVGALDERCPPGHQRAMYRALKEYVRVPAELVVYPGEPHGLSKYEHRKAKMEWDLAWFDRYVLGKTTEPPRQTDRTEPTASR